jgi:S-DNA-T family DNA segregation ATPase FtsK/SpoIIIE
MVLSRLKSLDLDLDEGSYQRLADKFIDDARDISGDIVLRAAKRGRNASELMGVVLSRFLVRHELGSDRHYGWYFLDDYAAWLGQREEQIADLMALSPEITEDGKLRLAILITEAKYIDASGLSAKRRESQKQLRDTVKRIGDALFGNPERLDREMWLSRLSDLLLDGVQFPASAAIDLGRWRRAIREGECEISLRGYSHVFISGPSDTGDLSDFAPVAGVEDAYQEVFSRAQLRDLVLRYSRDDNPMTVRQQSADENDKGIWSRRSYRKPAGLRAKARGDSKTNPIQEKSVSESQTQQGVRTVSAALLGDAGLSGAPLTEDETVTNGAAPEACSANATKPASVTPDTAVIAAWSSPLIQPLLDSSVVDQLDSGGDDLWLKQVESRTKVALQQFQLQAKLSKSVLTPNSALLKFVGSDNLTVDQVLRRRSEFLTTHGLNIISVNPEPGLISIAVERPQRQVVQLPEVWRRWRPTAKEGNQEVLIGVREADGEPLFLSPGRQHAPHTLIAGSTGSGKSVLMQNIILGVAATNTPPQARIILIDPKQGVDYFQFDGLPHLEGGIIDNQEEALSKLQSLVNEMDDRYMKFKAARASNLDAFNRKTPESERLPVAWVIHDEFAEWMMVEDYKEEVTALVGRLGVKARAAGIYLVFAAQRPDANVMPMQLRANLGNRLILRVDSEGTSEIALGERGAERLLGRGHLLAKLEGSPLCYAQVPFVDEDFMARLVEEIKRGIDT